jgi:YggT family protein
MNVFVFLIYAVLEVLKWALIIYAVLSWLIAFNVVNLRNQFVATISDVLSRMLEPLLRPIRRILPDLGGVDLSPLLLLIVIIAGQGLLTGALSFGF